jgi:curved DNA-binding protein CbpA
VAMKNCYQILEVSSDASQDVIKEQYHFLVQAWHPDKFPNTTQKLKAEEKIKEVNEAYAVLNNPIKRREYDDKIGLPRASRRADVKQHKREETKEHTPPPITVADVKRVWEPIIHSLLSESVHMGALLNSITMIDLQGSILVLGFASDVVKSKMKTAEIERTRKAIYDFLGVKVDVRCVIVPRRNSPHA